DARERGLKSIVALAAEIADPVRQRLFLERGGQVFGVPEQVLARAVGLRRVGQHSDAPVQAAVRGPSRTHGYVQRQLLQALLVAPQHRETVCEHLTPADFQDPVCRELAAEVLDGVESVGPEAQALGRELAASAAEGLDWAAIVGGAVRRMRVRRIE